MWHSGGEVPAEFQPAPELRNRPRKIEHARRSTHCPRRWGRPRATGDSTRRSPQQDPRCGPSALPKRVPADPRASNPHATCPYRSSRECAPSYQFRVQPRRSGPAPRSTTPTDPSLLRVPVPSQLPRGQSRSESALSHVLLQLRRARIAERVLHRVARHRATRLLPQAQSSQREEFHARRRLP